MSINRDMKPYMLQRKGKVRTESGQERTTWEDVFLVEVAVYKNSDMITTASVRYNASSHTGLTHHKGIKEGVNRLKNEDTVFQIIGCNTKPRLTNLMLKEVDTDA